MTTEEAIEKIKNIIIEYSTQVDYYKYYTVPVRLDEDDIEAIETVLNLIQKQQHIIEGKEALIDTQSHNEEVYMKALEKQEKRIKDLEAKLNAKEILMNTLPEETDFIILTKKDYSRNYIDELQKKEAIIDLMAERLVEAHEWFYSEFDNYSKEDFIEYYKRKVTDMNVGEQDK